MSEDNPVRVGIIGCGAISAIYLKNLARLPGVEAIACADIDPERARARAEEFGLRACTVDELLALDQIEIAINLTVPVAHADVSMAALRAGKHVYTEKPLAIDREDAAAILREADRRGLLVGCAPDTVLGGAVQTCRRLIDLGAIGRPVAATVSFMTHGMEWWHPNPQFFFKHGAGPLMDMGPYSLTALVHLIGAIRRVAAAAQITFPQRMIGSEPHRGETIEVEVPTHVSAVLELDPGAIASYASSWDVWFHHLPDMEVYGTEGSLWVGDTNHFLKALPRLRRKGWPEWVEIDSNSPYGGENWRGAGVQDMARALREGGPFRATGELGYHILDVMTAMAESAETHEFVEVGSRPPRPEPMPIEVVVPERAPGDMADAWLEHARAELGATAPAG